MSLTSQQASQMNIFIAPTNYLDGLQMGLVGHIVGATGLPEYYSHRRDVILSTSHLLDDAWANALKIAISKYATRSWQIDDNGDNEQRAIRWQRLLRYFDGRGWRNGQAKSLRDFYTTNNGTWIRIKRTSTFVQSKIIGFEVLDSLRCYRTGSMEYPVAYQPLFGNLEYLQAQECYNIVDMPSPRAEHYGLGQSAADRCFKTVIKLTAIETYLREKVSGSRNLAIHFITGVSADTLSSALSDSEQNQKESNVVLYRGSTIIPRLNTSDISVVTIPLAELPDGFNAEQERDVAYNIFANSLDVASQELKPLSGQGMGTGTQSIVLQETVEGRGFWAKSLEELYNQFILPATTTFRWFSRSLDDEKQEAETAKIRAETRSIQLMSGELQSTEEARRVAADYGDLPEELVSNSMSIVDDTQNAVATETVTDNTLVEENNIEQ